MCMYAQVSYGHIDLEECVGIATAAFAAATLRGTTIAIITTYEALYHIHAWTKVHA
jgi:Asp/Glu/hydantoin racemase